MIRRRPFLIDFNLPVAIAFITWRSDRLDTSGTCRGDRAIGCGLREAVVCSCMLPRSHAGVRGREGGDKRLAAWWQRGQVEPSNEVSVSALQLNDAIFAP